MLDTALDNARKNMVLQQIRPWDVFDHQVLALFAEMPRERFVPPAYHGLAYADIEVPLGHGEAMMPPRVEARLLQALAVSPDDKILEIGTGSGFLTACLTQLGGHVDSVDIRADFAEAADSRLTELGISDLSLQVADALAVEWPEATYDRIAVTGALPERVPALERALKPGGKLFVVLGKAPVMSACLLQRVDERELAMEPLFETLVAPLRNSPSGENFRF